MIYFDGESGHSQCHFYYQSAFRCWTRVNMEQGNRFSNDNALAIQIRWTNRLAVIQSLVIRSQQIVVYIVNTSL